MLKTVAIIAGAAALIATGIGAVAGAAGFLGVSAGAWAAIGTIAGVVSGMAGIGAQLLTKPPPARGSETRIQIGVEPPSPYLMGEAFSAGILRHDVAYGATLNKVPNPYRGMVIVASVAGPLAACTPMVDFSTDLSWYSTYLATDTQLGASPEAAALSPPFGAMPGWGSTSKLSGQAAILWNLKFDKDGKRFASGVPALGAVWQGVRVYDPRLDTTYPGGSGSQRIDDEATWAYSDNPALHAVAYAYGRYQNGKKVFGIGQPVEGIDLARFVAWANVCDANDWAVSGTIYEPGDRWANLKDIMSAGCGEPVVTGGVLSVRYHAPQVSLATVTEDDLADDDFSITAMQSYRDRVNGIVPKYRNPDANWEFTSAEKVTVSSYVTEDGEEKVEERQWNLVKDVDQVAQLAAYALQDARELGPIQITLKPQWRAFKPGECLTLDLPSLDYDGDAIILQREIDPGTMKVKLALIGETSAKHAYALGLTGTPPPTPALGQSNQERDELAAAALATGQAEIVGSAVTTVQASTSGTAAPGELPVVVPFQLFLSGTDRTADATWSATVTAGTAGVSITGGALEIATLDSNEATVRVSATLDGVESYFDHKASKRIAAADINTGTGGTSATDNSFNAVTTNTFAVVSDTLNITTGSSGSVALTAPLMVRVANSSPNGNYGVALRWQRDIAGTWTDVGTEETGTPSEANSGFVAPGSVSCAANLTLTPSTAYSFRLRAKATAADAVNRFLTGTASASGS